MLVSIYKPQPNVPAAEPAELPRPVPGDVPGLHTTPHAVHQTLQQQNSTLVPSCVLLHCFMVYVECPNTCA